MASTQMEQPTTITTEEAVVTQEVEQSVREAVHCALTLAQSNDADEALELLRNECSQAPATMTAAAYQAIIEAYLRNDRSEAAFTLLTEMHQSTHCCVPGACQELVLRTIVQTQQHARASELLRSMCAVGVAPGDAVFNSVLDAAVRARAFGEAWDVLELLLSHERRADKYFVSILTKSLESSNDRKWVRRGINLVDRFIEQQKDDVDEIVFNSLLNVLGHVGDMLKLQQTLNRMTEYKVPPSAVTYGTVVKAYGRARDIDAVLKVWNEMRTRCLGVNPVTCGCVLDACVKCGHLEEAQAIFQEMRLQGLHKNTVLYATLIKGLAKTRDLAGALHLYQEMRMEGVACNLVTFNSLMDVCVRCGNLPMAAVFLQDMIAMGIAPDLITFSTLIKGYSHTGEVHKAMALSKELKQRGLKCDEIMYNSLIDGCAKANRLPEGLAVFEDMLQSRVAPSNITFSILVKLYFEAGQWMDAFRVVDEMSARYRCVPSRIVYTVILRCCGTQGGPALARGAAMLTEMASKRNSKLPDQGMVSAIITGCVQHLDFGLASRVVREFASGTYAKRGSSGLVALDCLRTLFEALGAHDEPCGQELLEFLRRKTLPNNHVMQLQAAIAEGRRQAATGQIASVAANGNAGAAAFQSQGQTNVDPYMQWQNNAYAAQPYAMDYYQQYDVNYQPQMPQMGYYGNYQMPPMPQMPQGLQMPTYPMAPGMPGAPMGMPQQQMGMPQLPMQQLGMPQLPMQQMAMPAAPTALAPGLLSWAPAPAPAQWPAAAAAPAPAQMPAAVAPMPTFATPPPVAAPAQAPAPAMAPAPQPIVTEKKAATRRSSADKENAAPVAQVIKGNARVGLGEAFGQRQAI